MNSAESGFNPEAIASAEKERGKFEQFDTIIRKFAPTFPEGSLGPLREAAKQGPEQLQDAMRTWYEEKMTEVDALPTIADQELARICVTILQAAAIRELGSEQDNQDADESIMYAWQAADGLAADDSPYHGDSRFRELAEAIREL